MAEPPRASAELARQLSISASPDAQHDLGIDHWVVSADDEGIVMHGLDATESELFRISFVSDGENDDAEVRISIQGSLGDGTVRLKGGSVVANTLLPAQATLVRHMQADVARAQVPYGAVFDCVMNSLSALSTAAGCVAAIYSCAETVGIGCSLIPYTCGAGLAYSIYSAINSCRSAVGSSCIQPYDPCDPTSYSEHCCSGYCVGTGWGASCHQ